MRRSCPYCGEEVPSFSLTCPKCYREIPREEKKEERRRGPSVPNDRAPATQTYSRTIILVLAILPALFGIMGMAQIYQKKTKRGLKFLAVGLASFLIMAFCMYQMITSGGWAFLLFGLAVISLLVYLGTFIAQLFDAYARSLFNFR